jgi:small multidrug resistance family-3 protein
VQSFPEVDFMNILDRLVQNPFGALSVLTLAAFLEAWGDSFFQVGFYRSTGFGRALALLAGAAVLAAYGSVVNVPRWDFGKLLGAYVVLFFLMAQVLNKVRFGQSPTPPIYAGGALIVAGGMVVVFWKG